MVIPNSTDLLKEMHNPYVPSLVEHPPLMTLPPASVWVPALYHLCRGVRGGSKTSDWPLVTYLSQVAHQ